MKNTKMSQSKGGKAEVLYREIFQKINDIGQKTYKLKKDVNDVCGIILRKPGGTFFFEFVGLLPYVIYFLKNFPT